MPERVAKGHSVIRISNVVPARRHRPGKLMSMDALAATVLIVLLAMPLVIVGVMFVWAAIRDGEEVSDPTARRHPPKDAPRPLTRRPVRFRQPGRQI